MSARLVVPPIGLPVSLAAAISNAKADGADMSAEIELAVRGIAGRVEGEIGRALIEQTWWEGRDVFPSGGVKLAMSPLVDVVSVQFYDLNGELQTLDPQDYFVDNMSEPGTVMPAPGRAWPVTAVRKHAVQVVYRCGYGLDHTSVPPAIQSYILGRIAEKYAAEDREPSKFLARMLDGYRIYD